MKLCSRILFLPLVLITAAFVAPVQDARAAVTVQLSCDIDNDGTAETVNIINDRRAQVRVGGKTKKVEFDKRYPAAQWTASCADGDDDDNKLDLVLTKGNQTKTFSFFESSGSFAACKSVLPWPGSLVYKTIGSDHFSAGDPRRNAVNVIAKFGFRGADSCIEVYATNGNKLGQMGYYGSWVGGPARWYGPYGCGTLPLNGNGLTSRARQAAGSPNVIVKIANTCYGPINAGICIGSKGC